MNFRKAQRRLQKLYSGRVQAKTVPENRSTVLTGELDSWDDILAACSLFVQKKNGRHVVNHIHLNGTEIPEMRTPSLTDSALEGSTPDVLIIGGGVVGCAIARELSKWKLDILLVEKEPDVAMQASSRNDGEVHPGVDQKTKTQKLRYELEGNKLYSRICRELNVPFNRCGQYVAFKGKWLRLVLPFVAIQKRALGVRDTRVLSEKALYAAQPKLNPGYDIGLYNPSAGCVCPYGLTVAYAENALQNGAKISLNTAVTGMTVDNSRIVSVTTNRGTVCPKLVINAAGVFSDKIAAMAGDEFFSIHPRRGTEAVLDHKKGGLTDAIISWKALKTAEHNTKGGGVLHTVDDNILVGPDAVETYERENYATRKESIAWLFNKQKKTFEELAERDIITYFTGVRAATFEEDFIVEKGRTCGNILHCAGIQSPGLTAAPALALELERMTLAELPGTEPNEAYDPIRPAIPRVRELPDEERTALIQKNPDYGVIVCRCEEISRGEILDAMHSPLFAAPLGGEPSLDAIKRRVRPGMGRCQGGFCGPQITKMIAEFSGKELKCVTKNGGASYLSYGKTK